MATYQLGAGLALHQLGRSDEARAYLEEAIRLDPGLTPASVLLGLILHRAGDLGAAVRVYERALEHAPGDPQIAPRLEAWRREASLHGTFQQSMSTNFTVLFEGPAEQQHAARALERLEAAYWRIGGALGTYPAGVITVVLYTERQFSDVTRSPGWAAGLYDGRIKVPMLGALDHPDDLERVLAHELTHVFVHSLAARGVPQWLNEGLAGVFERADLSWAEATVRQAAALVPLDRLHGDFSGLSSVGARLAYAESALAARYLPGHSLLSYHAEIPWSPSAAGAWAGSRPAGSSTVGVTQGLPDSPDRPNSRPLAVAAMWSSAKIPSVMAGRHACRF